MNNLDPFENFDKVFDKHFDNAFNHPIRTAAKWYAVAALVGIVSVVVTVLAVLLLLNGFGII